MHQQSNLPISQAPTTSPLARFKPKTLAAAIGGARGPLLLGLMACSTLSHGLQLEIVPAASSVSEGKSIDIQIKVTGANELSQGQECIITGQLAATSASESRAVEGEDFEFSSPFSVTITGTANAGLRPVASSVPSEIVQLSAIDDHVKEGDEAIRIYIESKTITCPGLNYGGVVANGPTIGYGPMVTLVDKTFDTKLESLKLVPQLETIAVLTVSGAQARNKTLARQLDMARDNHSPRNRVSLKLDGQSLPEFGGAAGDDMSSSWGAFVTGDLELGDRTVDANNAFDFTTNTLIAGLDYRLGENWVFGGSLSRSSADADVKNKKDETKLDQNALSLFGSFYSSQFYVDAIFTQGANQYDLLRTEAGEIAMADTDGSETSIGLGAGYHVDFTASTLKLFSRLDYMKADLDGYTESTDGILTPVAINDFTLKSFTANIGAGWSWVINTGFGVLTPEIGVDFEHQFEGDGFNVDGQFVGGEPGGFTISTQQKDANYINGNFALNAIFPNGVSGFLSYTGQVGRDDWSSDHYALGARLEF